MSWLPTGFLEEIPKSDLHVHLDGSLRLSTLLELAKASGVMLPADTEEGMRREVFKDCYKDLFEYLEGFKYTAAVMKTRAGLERVAYEFAQDNYAEGVRYFEVRFAPQLVTSLNPADDLDVREVIRVVNAGLLRAKDEANAALVAQGKSSIEPFYEYGIIVCAMRMFPPSEYFDALAAIHHGLIHERLSSIASETLVAIAIRSRDEDGIPVVAIDIAGAEDGYPNKVHTSAFNIAHTHMFGKTVHAGEAYGPQSIFQAVIDLHAERIGHGYHLFSKDLIVDDKLDEHGREEYVRKLIKFVSDRRICFEVCLTSNLGTMPGLRLDDHAAKLMVNSGVSLTINTDNRLVSDTTTTKELERAVTALQLTPKQLREIVITGFKRSFFHGEYAVKRKYIRSVMDFYDSIAAKYKIQDLYNNFVGKYTAGTTAIHVAANEHPKSSSLL